MSFIDEKIVPLQMETRDLRTMSIESGYYINGIKVDFKETLLFDGDLSISLPENFVEMPLQIRELKYPSSFRPQIIRTNLGCDVNFTFSVLENLDGMKGKEIANNFCATLTRTNPSIQIYDLYSDIMKSGIEMAFLDFTSYGVDQQLYNLMGFSLAQDKIIQCTFNCPERQRYDWKDAAREVLLSLEILDLK